MTHAPNRSDALRAFAAQWLSDDLVTLEPASFDASFRGYWRARSREHTFIVMDAPPEKEDIRPWIDVAARLRQVGLHAPEVLAEDLGQGFVLMSDLGTQLYLSALSDATVDALYAQALDALHTMQTRADATGLPTYDEARLRTELELFPHWFLQRHLGMQPGCDGWDLIEHAFARLVASAREQPQRFVHRDFHSRNLLVVPHRNPGIIDFQDAVVGPVTYDLVSLLRDCYIAWPDERVYAWANGHRDRLIEAGVVASGEVRWKRWFDWMGLQRHLKVLGIFCRLWYRDGKPVYLRDLPLVLRYTLEVAARYKDLAPFADWLQRAVGDRDVTQPQAGDAARLGDSAAGAASAATAPTDAGSP